MHVDRRIEFFHMSLITADGARAPSQDDLWKELAAMTEAQRELARLKDGSESDIVRVWPGPGGEWMGACGRIRKRNLPLAGRGDSSRAIPLNPDEGIKEPSHFIWWDLTKMPTLDDQLGEPEGLLAMEFNHLGFKGNHLERYVRELLPRRWSVQIAHLPNDGILEELAAEPRVRAVKVRQPYASPDDDGDGDGTSMMSRLRGHVPGLTNVGIAEIRYLPNKGERVSVAGALGWLREATSDKAKGFSDATVTIEFDDRPPVRLGAAKLLAKATPIQLDAHTRSAHPDSVFQEIARVAREYKRPLTYVLGRKFDW